MSHTQAELDFLVPFTRELLRVDEVASCLRRSEQHVLDLIKEGKLEAHADPDREKKRYRVTRRSLVLYLEETALYETDRRQRLARLLKTLTTAELLWLREHSAKLLNRNTP